ncbi:nitroreductase family protein [Halanaerobium salsuginis]|jgi:hypothetical protein|uniref:Nitroreductase domain-containing protein n=1 Tax=Halanaerobium salsuginis TaxID=29563 RepID=A0A1I4IKP4_9FIRM|nr:nitroreductase family protein [Halanaerobium salsuginis]SFL54336.1 hypothetical protein SAMN02983006_01440 [Halanaerobium salsuginis]
MAKDIYQAIADRRSYYEISDEEIISEDKIEEVINHAVKHNPTAFNSQTGRIILLFGDQHIKFWDIVEAALKEVVPADSFAQSQAKIAGFRSGYGTILFYEDKSIVESLQEQFPLYKENFPVWSEHASGMLQCNIWTLLEAEGLGVSLQHYTELIEEQVKAEWDIPDNWRFVAQMPFGSPDGEPDAKDFVDLKERVKVYK